MANTYTMIIIARHCPKGAIIIPILHEETEAQRDWVIYSKLCGLRGAELRLEPRSRLQSCALNQN